MNSECDTCKLSLQILLVYFLALKSLLPPLTFNFFYTCYYSFFTVNREYFIAKIFCAKIKCTKIHYIDDSAVQSRLSEILARNILDTKYSQFTYTVPSG